MGGRRGTWGGADRSYLLLSPRTRCTAGRRACEWVRELGGQLCWALSEPQPGSCRMACSWHGDYQSPVSKLVLHWGTQFEEQAWIQDSIKPYSVYAQGIGNLIQIGIISQSTQNLCLPRTNTVKNCHFHFLNIRSISYWLVGSHRHCLLPHWQENSKESGWKNNSRTN